MLNDYFLPIELSVSWNEFLALPRNPAFRYTYFNNTASITANPRYYHCLLALSSPSAEPPSKAVSCFYSEFELRQVQETDWQLLREVFRSAFNRSPPLSQLQMSQQQAACERILSGTFAGHFGSFSPQSSFVIIDREAGDILGASLITLIPSGNLEDFDTEHWKESPPPNAFSEGWGQPHLTWIFVTPELQRRSLGTALLNASKAELKTQNYTHLASSFLLGDAPSMLWHWKSGFQLQSHPGSLGKLHRSP
ncbi:hypothetical protein SH668x_001583 [Planctomicrobium sp. SH668]|uniref:hypothetical protein n=1 Tax=Planctomicrobium sp. SH668 TaxID=3448126 RepID=UPI003F5B3E2A